MKSNYIPLLAILLIVIVFVSGCTSQTPSNTQPQQVTCNKPYILVGTSCCLDQNDNSVCDKDEQTEQEETTTTQQEATQQPSGTNYQTCVNDLLKNECKKYGLIYTDYSSAVEFITCTDDGAYSLDDIGDESKYLQVYAPTRTLQIKCGQYQEPTDNKQKCMENLFKKLCEDEGLIYTDYSSAVGFITCTDDGLYVLGEIGDETKYKQVYVTDVAINAQCS